METEGVTQDPQALQAALVKLTSERDEYKQLARLLREEVERLKRGLLGQKRERFVADQEQLTLQVLASVLPPQSSDTPTVAQRVKEHIRHRTTVRKLPESLPRVEMEFIPDHVQRAGLDNYVRIGEDTSEVVERRTGGMVVVKTIRAKFVPKQREKDAPTKVLIAPPPELPLPRSMAGPGLLAETVVRRWQDHLPLNRLEGIYAREGLELARSTLCEWHINLAALCDPLVTAMWQDALAQPVLMTDATGVLVQAKKECRNAHFWVVVAPDRHVLFRFTRKHDSAAVDSMLKGYRGYLVADAHSVFDHLYRGEEAEKPAIVECGCWAHCRRYFFKSLMSDPTRAREGLRLIGRLFELEREWTGLSPENRLALRKEHSAATLADFYAWADDQALRVLDDTPISKAIGYARNQRQALHRFLDDGRLPIHNNTSERNLRREAVGRKAWLFVGSDDGGNANATFVTLLASCQMHKHEPWAYLRDIFCLLPSWPRDRVLELSPFHWKETLKRPDVQHKLDANPYRRVTLGLPPLPV